jgi:hypothetical protein
MASSSRFSLTPTQRGELQAHLKSRNLPLGIALRMRIVLMLDEGASYSEIKEKLDTTAPTISLWKRRYRESGICHNRCSWLLLIRLFQQAPTGWWRAETAVSEKPYSPRNCDRSVNSFTI